MKLTKIMTAVMCAALMCACSDEKEMLEEYTPQGITSNSHLAATDDNTSGNDDDNPGGGDTPEGDLDGTLAARLNSTYVGPLVVEINGVQTAPSDETIEIERKDADHIRFHLKNFRLVDGEDPMYVGTILVDDIELTALGDDAVEFTIDRVIQIGEGDTEGVDMWLGPYIGDVPVKLKGVGSKSGMKLSIDIDMMDTLGQVIYVTFETK